MGHSEDQQAIVAVLSGDTNAYASLVTSYQRPVFNLMYRMTNSYQDAVDLTQEAFIRAYEHLHRFRLGENFYPWIYQISLNHARNFLRKNRALRNGSSEGVEPDCLASPHGKDEEQICSALDFQKVREALGRLPADYREAVFLRYHEGWSMEDIAKALEISVSGAKMRVHRGLKKIRQMLSGNASSGSEAGPPEGVGDEPE